MEDLDNLLRDVGGGSQSAFAELYDAISPRVHGLTLRIIANRKMAEQTTQEIFLHVWHTAKDFDHTCGSARTWILTIAHRCAVDCVRAHVASTTQISPVHQRDSHPTHLGDPSTEHQELDGESEDRWDAWPGEGGAQLEAVELAYFHGLSQQQIATLTGAPVQIVKTLMCDGLTRLRASA